MSSLVGRRGVVAAAAAIAAVLAALALLVPVAVLAQSGGAYTAGAEEWLESDCAGEVPIVVGSDTAAQSDIYSAITLAGAVDTDCVILAGARDADMPVAQRERLADAESGGYVVGGEAAVPAAKISGRDMVRIAGADRWITAQQVGAIAAGSEPADVPDPPSRSDSVIVESAGAHIRGAEGWFGSDCAGETPIVVGSDTAAQSDIYSAITLAGIVGTDCVILAGARDSEMPAAQQVRLASAESGGYVVGGEAAVPTEKVAGRTMVPIAGADRWETASLVGQGPQAFPPFRFPEGSVRDREAEAADLARRRSVIGLFERLRVEAEASRDGYDRGFVFGTWSRSNGQSTRQRVLAEEQLDDGNWYSAYDDKVVTRSSALDIDHLIPLAEAWESGGRDWSKETWRRFSNDLEDPRALIAVSASTNRSKGADDPSEWWPPHDDYHCQYAADWIAVKTRWSLAIDPAEQDALNAELEDCSGVDFEFDEPSLARTE